MKLRQALTVLFICGVAAASAELIPLHFAWTYDNLPPHVFKLYDAPTVTGPYVLIAVFPGASNGVLATNLLLTVDNSFNHFWFLTASNFMGESLPSNTLTGASPNGIRLFGVSRVNKTN